MICLVVECSNISQNTTKKESNQDSLHRDSITNNSVQNIKEQLWFSNPQHGLIFETPHAINEEHFSVAQGTEDYINNGYSYSYVDKDYGVKYVVLEVNENFTSYDAKTGLNGSVSNFLNGWKDGGVQDLKLEFTDVENNYEDNFCEGAFIYMNTSFKIKGYCIFKDNKIYTLIGSGADNIITTEKLNRTFSSIQILGGSKIGI